MLRVFGPLSLALAPAVAAQQDAVDFARASVAATELLASNEPADVAWGAHLAQRLQLRGVEPALRASLRTWTTKTGDDSRFVRHYVLDAVIQLGITLPGEELAPQLGAHFDRMALIVMARDPTTHASLLFGLVQKYWLSGDSSVRLAAGNLLAADKAPGFAAWLMQRLPLRLHVTVRDRDPDMIGFGPGGASASIRTRVVTLPAAYPPLPRYRLMTQAAPFSVQLAAGGQPVFFERTEDEERRFRMLESNSIENPPAPSAHRWLLEMARSDAERLGLPLTRIELLRWRDPETYREQILTWRAAIDTGFAELGRRLVIRGALTEAEAGGLTASIEVEVDDQRTDRRVPLPEVATRSGR